VKIIEALSDPVMYGLPSGIRMMPLGFHGRITQIRGLVGWPLFLTRLNGSFVPLQK
jgi:hypothetical protein